MKKVIGILGVVLLSMASLGQESAPVSGPTKAATTGTDSIPQGTTLVIRTNESIKTQEAGKTYKAEVAQNVENQSGQILVPKGSEAELAVLRTSGGTVGTQQVELALQSITVNGKRFTIASDTSTRKGTEGIGKNERTAQMVGGGAILGTLLGAIAGGGKGAAIGAISGAAGGAAVQVLTRGKEVNVPAETLLTFQTTEDLRLAG